MKNVSFKTLKYKIIVITLFLIFVEPSYLSAQTTNITFNILDSVIIYSLNKSNTQDIKIKFCILNDSNNYRLYEFYPIIGVSFENPFKSDNLNRIAGIYYCLFDSARNFIYGDIGCHESIIRSYLNKKKNLILFNSEKEFHFRTESPFIDIFYDKELSIDLYPFFGCYQSLKKGKYYIQIFYNFNHIPLNYYFNDIKLKCEEANIKLFVGHLESKSIKLIVK